MKPFTATAASIGLRQRVSPAEWEIRVKLAAAYRIAAQLRWTDHIYTHFSARVPGEHEHFLINAYGLLFDEISASNLVKVDIDGTLIDDPMGLGINQAGYVIHSAIHRARPDLKAVLHTHTRDGAAVSAQRGGLLPLSQHALAYYSRVAYHEYEGIALDLDEQQRLVANLGDSNILILRNHGLLTGGVSVEHAFRELHGLERACNIQIAAQAGGNVDLLHASTAAIGRVREQAAATAAGRNPGIQLHWNALIRQLNRETLAYAD
ncbi:MULTISPECIES: class II aldolase/adducin family protein [unclassified Pseudomonas]|uniref:class II aldolase/adducin family protein n=1 Tax=unclassified Pseudomonas TaxID=196821 RepID=UPI000BCA3D35|nr:MULTISPECIES: class II aldolase/adducin family protein [unclassified Pseudomonas]PVZ20769.1 ribulose-5-phosphate 4-epimerase/fuculose-1-phosphate aldolase [Pseudomonas sp. URIL14HWK12:I12]PVZ27835.1 ribulose-5-phosphate 4-epimerase/fuculose-1-phosphate aldolase [Pseudomonas sp. URIL14HWK12:I10]PVZ38724.1 ribulose-5-phosphate 4-epimerase/fuculose-1-phosphate aldolase [Pseudomonas sp. URIL14HWK12:I11]SNZ02251.1 Ribulose-5-phosphate 4-epimerase/Fuculose-1-phosphate aldolase [Pseudomonas sp. URI